MGFIKRLKVVGENIYIASAGILTAKATKLEGVMLLTSSAPIVNIFEGKTLSRSYKIDTLGSNSDLTGQFLHYAISVQDNDAVMIDGIVSNAKDFHKSWQDDDYEAIRLQPFFLRSSAEQNDRLIGKGLFQRGLHYSGTVTPKGVRVICICDHCQKSFTLQHIHAGLSEVQYFYSTDGMQTLLVGYKEIADMPVQLANNLDSVSLSTIEAKLPDGFRYYNSLPCPHCKKPFINFDDNPNIRPSEYYANKLINADFRYLN